MSLSALNPVYQTLIPLLVVMPLADEIQGVQQGTARTRKMQNFLIAAPHQCTR
jgi:hypothetical protein